MNMFLLFHGKQFFSAVLLLSFSHFDSSFVKVISCTVWLHIPTKKILIVLWLLMGNQAAPSPKYNKVACVVRVQATFPDFTIIIILSNYRRSMVTSLLSVPWPTRMWSDHIFDLYKSMYDPRCFNSTTYYCFQFVVVNVPSFTKTTFESCELPTQLPRVFFLVSKLGRYKCQIDFVTLIQIP